MPAAQPGAGKSWCGSLRRSVARLFGDAFSGDVLRGAAGTALSRLIGLGREVVVAHVFGASAAYDAFLIAYFIPNLLRRLFGEGGLAAAFLPLYVRALGEGKGAPFLRATALRLALVLVPICGLGIGLAPYYVPLLAAGFSPEKLGLAFGLARWVFPFLALVSFSALSGAVLNAHRYFFLPALAPSFWSLGLILGAAFLAGFAHPPVLGLAWGLLAGGAGMVVLQAPASWPHLFGGGEADPELIKEVARRLVPVLGGLAIAEINMLVDNRLASYLADGSVATLQYAMRLFQLPIGILAVSISNAALPRLASSAANADRDGFAISLRKGVELGAVLLLPATFGLLVLGRDVVGLLFQHGAFTAADSVRTAAALHAYSVGLWAYGLVYLFSRAFYALGRPAVPVLTAAVAVGVNIALDLAWVGRWQTFGLALATGIAGWADALLQGVLLLRFVRGWLPWRAVGGATVAAAAMGGLVYLSLAGLRGQGAGVRVAVGLALGLLAYSALGKLFRLDRAFRGAR